MPSEKISRVLAIGAHPDNMEQFCGGTLLLLKRKGLKIMISPLTNGECGSETESAKSITLKRDEESRKSAKMLGASYYNFHVTDGCIEYNLETVKRIVVLFRKYRPDIIFTHLMQDYMKNKRILSNLLDNIDK